MIKFSLIIIIFHLISFVFSFLYQNNMCGGAGKGGNCRILKKLSYSVIIKIDPFCHIMHLKFLNYLKYFFFYNFLKNICDKKIK